MDDQTLDALRRTIRQNMASGKLPNIKPVGLSVGQLLPALCVACGLVGEKGYDVLMADGRAFRFHSLCLSTWHQERGNLSGPPPDSN